MVVLINNLEMTALLLRISLQSIIQIKKAQDKHFFKTHSHTAVPCSCSRDWIIILIHHYILPRHAICGRKHKKVFKIGNQKMFSTSPKTRLTVLRKHQWWLFQTYDKKLLHSPNDLSVVQYLTIIIGRGWAKYHDLSVASNQLFAKIFCHNRVQWFFYHLITEFAF